MEAHNFFPSSFRILSVHTVLISSVADCWFCLPCPDELIHPSAEYNLFTYTRQFCIKNIPLSSDKFFRTCHAVKHYLGPCSYCLPILPSPCLEQILFSISFSVLPVLSNVVSGVCLWLTLLLGSMTNTVLLGPGQDCNVDCVTHPVTAFIKSFLVQ